MPTFDVHRSLADYILPLLPSSMKGADRFFVFQCLAAILATGRCLVSEWARSANALRGNLSSVYKRFERHLGSLDLRPVCEKCLSQQTKALDHTWVVAIDQGDIAKPHAEKMEALDKVVNGSMGHTTTKGYWLLSAVAMQPSTRNKTPLPLHLELFSCEECRHTSENTKIINVCQAIKAQCPDARSLPLLVMDRGGDRLRLITKWLELGFHFLVRLNGRSLEDLDAQDGGKRIEVYPRDHL